MKVLFVTRSHVAVAAMPRRARTLTGEDVLDR